MDKTSEAENILKKGIEALHNNDFEGVNKYFNLYDEDFANHIRRQMEENDSRLYDQIEVLQSVWWPAIPDVVDERCHVLANMTDRRGRTEKGEFTLTKDSSKKWKIHYSFETTPRYWNNDITQTVDVPRGKHPIFGNMLDTFEKIDVRYLEKEQIVERMKESAEEAMGNEVPVTGESRGLKVASATVSSWNINSGMNLNVVVDLEPEDPNYIKSLGRRHSLPMFYCLFCSSEGTISKGVAMAQRNEEILTVALPVWHNHIGAWRKLKYIEMVDIGEYNEAGKIRITF